jgi:hypothetical protein
MMLDVIVVAAALQYIVLQTLDGRTVYVNPRQIVSTSQARGKLVVDAVQCVIYTTDNRFLTVAETCESVKARLEALGVR